MFTIKHSLFFLIIVVPELFCYVFHVDYSYKYETNNTNGYTAMLLQKAQNGFWLIAGAPKFDTVTVCNPTCRGYSFSEKNPAGAELLGAVMDGGERADDPLYVCAPRHVTTPQYRANGRCFAWNDRFKSIQSLSNPLLQVQLYNSSYEFFYAHGQAGFSIKYIGGTEFLIGAPGVLSWKGTVIKHTTYDSKDILNVEKKFERHSYLGYSIEYDTFHFNSVKRRCVIAGAPRANDLGGMILKPQKTRKPLRDIGLSNEDSDDTTAVINKSCRRVSFASNNFVKPFVTDPEENTIWDRTYEEAIEQSDTPASIHSMQGENENDPNRLNMTIIGGDNSDLDLTPPVDGVLESAVVKDKTVMDDMEFTTAITNVLVFNGNNAVNKEMTVDDMELTMVTDLKAHENIVGEATIFNDTMEFTKLIQENADFQGRINSDLVAEQTADDTEKLINLELLNTEKVSDFSKVITGDVVAPFTNLPTMRLRGINSTSFVQDYISEAKTRNSENDQSAEDMDISLLDDDDDVKPEIIITSPTDDDMDITRDDNATDANVTDDKIKDNEVSDVNLNKSNDVIPEEGNSIVELCAKITMENSALLCDTSALCISTDSSVDEVVPDVPTTSSSIDTDEAEYVLGIDNLPPYDGSRMDAITKNCQELVGTFTRHNQKVKKKLEEEESLIRECIEKYKRKRRLLDEFEALSIKAEEILSSECTEESDESESLTWKEKILKLSEGNDGYWAIVSLDSNPCKFTTLYGTIGFNANIDDIDGEVTELQLEDRINANSQTIIFYIHKIFMEKLKLKPIQSALGEKFEILSLLDYIRLTMEKLLEIDKDYTWLELKYGASIDKEFRISFALISVKLMISWVFTIDVRDYDNINKDKVTFYSRVGDLRERDIQKCLNSCPKGFGFVRAFIETMYRWLEDLERK